MEQENNTIDTTKTIEQNDTTTEATIDSEKQEAFDGNLLKSNELLAGKYKTQEELEKGYNSQAKYVQEIQAENKELKKNIEVPEEYKFDFDEDLSDVGLEPGELNEINKSFKEAGLSQNQAEKLMDKFISAYIESIPDVDQIKEDLGPKAKEIIDDCQAYINKFPNIEDRERFNDMCNSAENVEFLHRMVVSPNLEKSIPGNTVAVSTKESLQDMKENLDKFWNDNKDVLSSGSDTALIEKYESMFDSYLKAKNKGLK